MESRLVQRASTLLPTACIFVVTVLLPVRVAIAQPSAATLKAWHEYIARTETRIDRELGSTQGFLASDFTTAGAGMRRALEAGEVSVTDVHARDAGGQGLPVPGGLIHHWRGSILLPGLTLDVLLHRLQYPAPGGPLPDDVLAMRVLGRDEAGLRMFMRLSRSSLVTAVYDTEHAVRYHRHAPQRASSRSVATRITEVDASGAPRSDRGFLWRLNAYWRYEEVPSGVIVELESVTLSRSVPFGLGLVVHPVADRIARESVVRTLRSHWVLYGAGPPTGKTRPRQG